MEKTKNKKNVIAGPTDAWLHSKSPNVDPLLNSFSVTASRVVSFPANDGRDVSDRSDGVAFDQRGNTPSPYAQAATRHHDASDRFVKSCTTRGSRALTPNTPRELSESEIRDRLVHGRVQIFPAGGTRHRKDSTPTTSTATVKSSWYTCKFFKNFNSRVAVK